MRTRVSGLCLSALLFLFLLLPAPGHAADSGIVKEGLLMKSAILKKDVRYSIYLPPDYDRSARSYPILYMLHGGEAGMDADWFVNGQLNQTMDRMIADGSMPPMIVVTPDGRRDETLKHSAFYMNDADGGYKWEDMFIKEFIGYIEKTYRVTNIPGTGKRHRSIGGLSMGGYGALVYSWLYPDLFRSAVALSAAVRTDDDISNMDKAGYDRRYAKAFGMGLEGKNRLSAPYKHYNPMYIAERLDAAVLGKTRVYIDCGSDDRFMPGNSWVHISLIKKKVPHVFMIRPGIHNWEYWRTGLPGALQFVAEGFLK